MNPPLASYKKYTLRFKKPAGTSRGTLRQKTVFFIRLADRRRPDRLGLGECAPWPGLSPDDRPDFEAKLAGVCDALNRGQSPTELDLAGWPALAFGLETAWLDWQHGGSRRLFENDFSRRGQPLPIHGLIWMGSPEEMLHQVQRKVSQGHTCLKLKIGALDFAAECAVLADIRRRYPPDQIELRLDANGAFAPEIALERLTGLAQFHIHAIEQPIKPGHWPAMAALCAHSPIKIALDEELIGVTSLAGKRELLATIEPHYLVLKPALLGGLASAETWIALAQELGSGWWVNSALESNIGLNALCQWTSSLNPTMVQGLGSGQLYTNNIPSPIKPSGGALIYDHALAWDVSAIVA
ncbi:MAG: o-succinylbenzoate synthase [Chloroflexota bacterium]